MSEKEINILSRLAMLKASDNVGERFSKATAMLSGKAKEIAIAIKNNNRNSPISKSLLEWAEYEIGKTAE